MKSSSSSLPAPAASPGLVQRLADRWRTDPASRSGTGTIARLFASLRPAPARPATKSNSMAELEEQFAALKTEQARQAFVVALANQVRAVSKPKQPPTPVRRAKFALMPAKGQASFLREGGRVLD